MVENKITGFFCIFAQVRCLRNVRIISFNGNITLDWLGRLTAGLPTACVSCFDFKAIWYCNRHKPPKTLCVLSYFILFLLLLLPWLKVLLYSVTGSCHVATHAFTCESIGPVFKALNRKKWQVPALDEALAHVCWMGGLDCVAQCLQQSLNEFHYDFNWVIVGYKEK